MAAPHNDNIRGKILEGAGGLLSKKAFNEISLAEIAKEAGVSKGSVYYYYKNKDHILYDIADDYLAKMFNDLRAWVEDESKDTSLPRLLNYVLERGIMDPGKNIRLNLTLDAASGDEILREKLLNRYNLFKAEIGQLIWERIPKEGSIKLEDSDIKKEQPKIEPEDKPMIEFYGWLMVALVDGLMIQNLLDNKNLDEKTFAKKLSEVLK